MNNTKMTKGIIIGTIIPIISSVLVKLIFYSYIPFKQILRPHLFSTFIQFGIIANLLLFYYFMVKNKQEIQKGIVLPTLLYVILAMYMKYFS
tara:strand:+ start:158 stop:433 length:276 start_codon:yes stop_codon:yes gene_type:complete